jgi:hypothetical protein
MSPEEFNARFGPELAQTAVDPHPYGTNPHQQPAQVKTGLTPRGKAGIAIACTVVAGGGLLGWQHYAAEASANQVKVRQLAIEQDKLELAKIKELNRQATEQEKAQAKQNTAAQKQIDACVDANKDLIGKRIGTTYQTVQSDCQAQYGTTSTDGMQEAAAANTTSGGGVNNFLLVGGGVLAIGLVIVVRRATRPSAPPPPYYPY